jgi:hypothetical protein
MITLTWVPPVGDPVIFSRDATDYRLLLNNATGFASIPGEHIYADKAPMRHGQVRKYTILGQRQVSFEVTILSDDLTSQQTLVQELANAFNPLNGAGILQYAKENGDTYYLNCISVNGNPVLSQTDKTQTIQKATIRLVADEDPFWHFGNPGINYFSASPPNFFPFPNGTGVWPWVPGSRNKTKICTVDGSVESPVIITFTGPMVNPLMSVTRTVAGAETTEILSFVLTLAAGESLVVNTDPDVMTAQYYPASGPVQNAHKYVDLSVSTFWTLLPGANTVTLSPSSSSAGEGASVQWSDRYVGV